MRYLHEFDKPLTEKQIEDITKQLLNQDIKVDWRDDQTLETDKEINIVSSVNKTTYWRVQQ